MDNADVMRDQHVSENRPAGADDEDAAGRYPPDRALERPVGTKDRPAADVPYDGVDECGVASFPASDPPSWWSGR
jgi:hypothetical protein